VFDFLSNRITIPIYDNNGYLVAFSGRTIQDAEPKYLNTSTTKLFSKANTLFNFARAKQVTTNKLIIVEGYMDAITYYRVGFPNVVATMGVALSNEHMNALSTLTSLETVILSFDNDNAGQIATINHGQKLMENGFNTYVVGAYDKSIKDVDELLNKHGKLAIDKILDERVDYMTFLINSHFVKSLPLDEIQKATNEIIKMMIDLGDNSLLLRSKHLKLLAEKSGLDYQDLLAKYERDIQKINVTSPTEKTFIKKPYKPTNDIGLDKTFIEDDEPKTENVQQNSLMSSLQEEMTSQRSLALRSLTDAYDYLIQVGINNPALLQRVSHDLTFNTTFEFEQQDIILKSIRYLQEKQAEINDKIVLDLLKTKGEKNPKYLKAHDYLSKQLNHSYYVNYSKNIFTKNAEHRIDVTIKNIINLKKELLLYNKIIKMIELAKNDSSENNPEIDKILLDIKMIKKIKN
jgi:DNA primase